MEEQKYKICVACTTTDPVEGCESMTLEEAETWLHQNQEYHEQPLESGDTVKYIMMPADFISHELTPILPKTLEEEGEA